MFAAYSKVQDTVFSKLWMDSAFIELRRDLPTTSTFFVGNAFHFPSTYSYTRSLTSSSQNGHNKTVLALDVRAEYPATSIILCPAG